MDRRRIRTGSGLHKMLQPAVPDSQSSMREGPSRESSVSLDMGQRSQKISNTEMLRRQMNLSRGAGNEKSAENTKSTQSTKLSKDAPPPRVSPRFTRSRLEERAESPGPSSNKESLPSTSAKRDKKQIGSKAAATRATPVDKVGKKRKKADLSDDEDAHEPQREESPEKSADEESTRAAPVDKVSKRRKKADSTDGKDANQLQHEKSPEKSSDEDSSAFAPPKLNKKQIGSKAASTRALSVDEVSKKRKKVNSSDDDAQPPERTKSPEKSSDEEFLRSTPPKRNKKQIGSRAASTRDPSADKISKQRKKVDSTDDEEAQPPGRAESPEKFLNEESLLSTPVKRNKKHGEAGPSTSRAASSDKMSKKGKKADLTDDEDETPPLQRPSPLKLRRVDPRLATTQRGAKSRSIEDESAETADKANGNDSKMPSPSVSPLKRLSRSVTANGSSTPIDRNREHSKTPSPSKSPLKRLSRSSTGSEPSSPLKRLDNSPATEKRISPRLSLKSFSEKLMSQRLSNSERLRKMMNPVVVTANRPDNLVDPTSPENGNVSDKLKNFFRTAGIELSDNEDPHELDDDRTVIERRLIDQLGPGKFDKDEITRLWKEYVRDVDNLSKALCDVKMTNKQQNSGYSSNLSLVRMMLQIPEIQTAVANDLFEKLTDAILSADSMDDVPWAIALLQPFRFLEQVVQPDALTTKLEELLETCPIWFQRELIIFLPDIVIDVQHLAIAKILTKLMESQQDLTSVVIDCITNLTLSKDHLEDLRENILAMLTNNIQISRVPPMTRFVLSECTDSKKAEKVMLTLRRLDLQPLAGDDTEEYFTNQSLFVSELRMSIMLSPVIAKAAQSVIKRTDEKPTPIDLILHLLLYSIETPRKKKIVETTMKQHIKRGFYRKSLITSFYEKYREVGKQMQKEALNLSSCLLKSEDRSSVDFAIDWIRQQFANQSEATHKQREIIEKIILLMGNNDQTAKGALKILRKMTETEEEMKYLQAHSNHLRILLEKIDNFDLEEVATLSDVLHALCASENSHADSLQDDLFILLQKQLSNAKTLTKFKGVLSAAMAIKHLAGKAKTCKTAEDIFAKVHAGVRYCPRSQALFYDEIGNVIADTSNIHRDFLMKITSNFQDEFMDVYMTDADGYSGDLREKYGLNKPEVAPQRCLINFRDGKYGAVVPAFFRLLRICFMRLSDGDLEDINLLLGCPVLMPQDDEMPEAASLDLTICTINWFRELISGFVNQSDSTLQAQVLKRLDNLMGLQAEFSDFLAMAGPHYQPPPCYFHVFPAPAFVRREKKASKKGKRRSTEKQSVCEWEAWEIGSALCAKNPNYFRRLDAKVVELLDRKMDLGAGEGPCSITISQVCFIVNELLSMLNGDVSESLVRDLVNLLPKICSKLNEIVEELRERNDEKNRYAARLILSLLSAVFDWKEFQSAKFHKLLRDGLIVLACQVDKTNTMLRSSRELVAESYKYFESLADIATDISLAFIVVKTCRSLMQHSETFTRMHKNKQAKLASAFLALEWPDDKLVGATYKTAVLGFLKNWFENEPDPLETVTTLLEWLPEQVAKFEKPQDRLERLPSITKATFPLMFQKLFRALINGAKISLANAETDPEKLEVWKQVALNVNKIVTICKSTSRLVLPEFMRSMTNLLIFYHTTGIPLFEQNLRFHKDEITQLILLIRGSVRYMHQVCVDSSEKQDIALSKIVPQAKRITEKIIYAVKALLAFNNSGKAFWMGNLANKNLEGQLVRSQSTTDDSKASTPVGSPTAEDSDACSEILESDVEEELQSSSNDES